MNKPFNLDDALAGKPVVTRDGHKVLFIADTKLDTRQPILAIIEPCDVARTFSRNGRYYTDEQTSYTDEQTSYMDLFMAPTKVMKYVNLHCGHTGKYFTGSVFSSRSDAEKELQYAFYSERVAVLQQEVEE